MALPTFQAVGAVSSGVGAVTPGFPASGVLANDVAIMVVQSSNEAITTPTGFTQVSNSPQFTGTAATAGAVRIGVFYKICTGTENGTTVTVNDTGNHTVAQILIYRGVNTAAPINATAGGTKAVASTSSSIPGVTTTVNECMIVAISGNSNDANSTAVYSGWTNANLTSLTERIDRSINRGTGGGFGVADGGLAVAGSSGTTTATIASSTEAYLTVALAPIPSTNSGKFFLMF